MTNAERQKSLDKQKYLTSEKYKEDQSGSMPYCMSCEYAKCTHKCRATQEERESKCLCAKAFNRLKRAK